MSTFWDFTANTTSVIKTLRDADPPREQTFIALSLKMVDNLIYLYDAGVYSSAIAFEQIGDIDGVAPTDLQDAYDKILAIIPQGGGGIGVRAITGNVVDNTDPSNPIVSLTAQNVGTFINSLSVKSTPTITDLFTLTDKADTNKQKKITTVQLSAYLKTYFDQYYASQADLLSRTDNTILVTSPSEAVLYTNHIGVGGDYELDDFSAPNAGDGYYFYVVSGTIILNGTDTFNAGDLVYRFFDGMVWTSKNFNNTSGGATNLGYTASPTDGTVTSDTGTDATLPLADTTNAGLLAPADKTKLNNTSGTNTGDNSANTNSNAYADAKVTDAIVDGVTAIAPSQNAVFDALALKAPLASPALTGNPTAPTQSANDNSTKIANTAYVDASALLRKDLVLPGKTIVVFGDSYSTGVGATNTGRGYINILKDGIGCGISNNAVQGTTIMKRTPVNYISSPNMVDNATNIPTYSEATHGLLLFEFGLNDMGQNGANYTTANFIADYQTVLTYANGTKGWPFNKILILGAPYANSTGYAAYAVLSGNAAPTTQHHLDFIEAARQVAQTNQTMFIDLYAAQVKNGVSTTMNADGYHPNDAGHFAIAKIIGNYLGYTGIFESRVPVSSSTPSKVVSGGASYSVTLGEQANMVAVFYNDGVNIAGIGESSNTQEYHIYSGGKHNFYINNVLIHSLKTTGPETTLVSTTGGLKVGYVAKTANYTIGTNDHTINCTANSFTVTLPSAITVGSGKIYCINNAGSGTITVATTSSQTIDGTTPGTLTQNHNITVMSDGANWIILSQK